MAFGSITFRGYMLTYSTYLTLAALPLATMPQKMLETATADPANTSQDPFAMLLMSQLSVPMFTAAGFMCLAATVKDLKFQRDICCVLCTAFAGLLASRVLVSIPVFGIRDILPWLLVESLLGLVPLAWLFRGHFTGAANTPSAHGTFRTLCLAQTTVWFVHACLFAFNALTAGAYVPDHENLRVSPKAGAWFIAHATIGVLLAGMLCVMSGTTSEKLRRRILHVFAIHYALTVAWRLVHHFGVPVPSMRIPVEESGFDAKSLPYMLAIDTLMCLPMVAAFVWVVVLGKPATTPAKRSD